MRLNNKQLNSLNEAYLKMQDSCILNEGINFKKFLDKNPWVSRLLGFGSSGRPEKFQAYVNDPRVQGPAGIVGTEMAQAAKRKMIAPFLLAPRTLGNVEADLGRMNRLEKHAQTQYGAYKI
jgi:hypothetical protein